MIDLKKNFKTDKVLLGQIQIENLEEMLPLTSNQEMWTYFKEG